MEQKSISCLDKIILQYEKDVEEILKLEKSKQLDLSKYEEPELTYVKSILKKYS